jgi:very-short-patch-repair endonuclease
MTPGAHPRPAGALSSGTEPTRGPSATEGRSSLAEWIDANGGIAHRDAAADAGYSRIAQRAAVRAGGVSRVRRHWLVASAAPSDLVVAAANCGSLTCISAARRRGWWMPDGVDDGIHLRMPPHGPSPVDEVTAHWTNRIAPPPGYGLMESIEDTLAHVALCLTPEDATIVWDSALRKEGISLLAIQRVRWPTARARECAERVTGLADSGLETRAVLRLRRVGLLVRQQVVIAGRPVDILIGEMLVVQIDGFAFHSSSRQRTKDVAGDAELILRGYTVLRFTYAQIEHDWPAVERTIARAVAAGAHLAR